MSGATRSMDGAATFQIGITLSVGPPLSYVFAIGLVSGSRSAAFAYIGSGYTALPAAATLLTKRATDQAWKYSSALSPKTCCQLPVVPAGTFSAARTSGVSNSAGTEPSNNFCAVGE